MDDPQSQARKLRAFRALHPGASLLSPRSAFFPSRHELLTPLPARSKQDEAGSYFSHPKSTEGYLFLGFDLSTQGLKVIAVNEVLSVVAEAKVDFSDELPHFQTVSGVTLGEGGVVTAPVQMYLEAVDLLFEKLQASDFPFDKVVSISGAGQQHAMVLWSSSAPSLLSSLSPTEPLATQLFPAAFSSDLVTNWQDSSTGAEARAIEEQFEGGREALARVTGSKAHERFTGVQLLKLRRTREDLWDKTDRVSLVSSFLCTILCSDGSVKGIDEADACGANIYDIPRREWNPELLKIVSGSPDPTSLASKLGEVERDPSRVVGKIGRYFVERYGFDEECVVSSFTGDNPATLLSFTLSPGDAVVSLGTSDTVLLASDAYGPDPAWHVFAHPAGDGADERARYMSMLCYKNGSLSRERVRNSLSPPTWERFSSLAISTPAPTSSSSDISIFSFDKPEIIPSGVSGTFIFRNGELLPQGGEADLTDEEREQLPRRILEAQFLSFRKRSEGILGEGRRLGKVFVAGGGSVNSAITSLLADILGCPVYAASGSAQGCANGAAFRAAHAYKRLSPDHSSMPFEEVVRLARQADGLGLQHAAGTLLENEDEAGLLLVGTRKVATPTEGVWEEYGRAMGRWEEMERVVLEQCRKDDDKGKNGI